MKKNRKKQGVSVLETKPFNYSLLALVALIVARPFVPEDPGSLAGYGVTFILLWLMLAIGWIVQQWRSKQSLIGFDTADWLLFAFVGWQSLSAVLAAIHGSPRPAVNMLWEWVCIGLVFLLARRIFSTKAQARGAIVVMIGLAVGMSLVAIEQRFFSMPRDHEAFEAVRDNPAQLYALSGQWLPPNSPELSRFENRLLSQQPSATFALTNSLAGFLVPWSLLLTAILFGSDFRSFVGRSRIAIGGLGLLAMIFALALTGSRTAMVATLAGLMALGFLFCWRTPYRRFVWKLSVVLLVISLSGAIGANQAGVGRETLRNAARSVAFRVEYWQATLAMIADHPLVGCGPGQFQDVYTRYKLPTASEEIQDPHNWLLEVTATAGIPAGILLLALIVLIVWKLYCTSSDFEAVTESAADDGNEPLLGAACGLTLGLVLAYTVGFAPSLLQVALIAVGITSTWWLLLPWVRTGKLDSRALAIAMLALLLNLTAAGGISYPSIADTLWLLAAVGMGGRNREESAKVASGFGGLGIAGVCGILLVMAYLTAFQPVTKSQSWLVRADSALLSGRHGEHAEAVAAAAAADPWSAPAALRLAMLRLAEYEERPSKERLDAVDRATASMLRLTPQKSEAWVKASEIDEAIYRQTSDRKWLESGLEHQQQAIELYPGSPQLHARLAELLQGAGDSNAAADAARQALKFDQLMEAGGHNDRRIPAAKREKMREIADKSATFDAENPPPVQ